MTADTKASTLKKIGYKIVLKDNSGFLNYDKTGGWTLPEDGDGPLTLFDTFVHALDFMKHQDEGEGHHLLLDAQIWECEYTPSSEKRVWIIVYDEMFSQVLEALPLGTQLASRLKLLEICSVKKEVAKNDLR